MTKRLTAKALAALKPGREYKGKSLEARSEVPDGDGLYVVLGEQGPRSWVLRYRRPEDARAAKLTLGKVFSGEHPPEPRLGGRLTLAGARRLAHGAKVTLGEGRDPGQEKKRANAERKENAKDTFGAVLAEYYKTAVPLKRRNRTADASRKLLEKNCAEWFKRPVRSVTRRDVRDLLNGIVRCGLNGKRGSPAMANSVRAMLGPVFTWAWKQERIAENPIPAVDAPAEHRDRQRCPDDSELVEIWRAANTLGAPWSPLAKVLVLTGQRLGAVEAMQWDHLHDLEGTQPEWRVPAGLMKMDADFVVPLSPPVVAIIKEQNAARQKLPKSAPFVFWSGRLNRKGTESKPSGRSRFRGRWRAAVNEARTETGRGPMPDWRPHDLRRSMSSGLARLGVPLHVTELALDHRPRSIRGVAAVYQKYEFLAERRYALDLWANHVMALADCKNAGG